MNGWILLWKIVFVVGVAVFAGLAVWVTVAGFRDIKRLIGKIREEHAEGVEDDQSH